MVTYSSAKQNTKAFLKPIATLTKFFPLGFFVFLLKLSRSCSNSRAILAGNGDSCEGHTQSEGCSL